METKDHKENLLSLSLSGRLVLALNRERLGSINWSVHAPKHAEEGDESNCEWKLGAWTSGELGHSPCRLRPNSS